MNVVGTGMLVQFVEAEFVNVDSLVYSLEKASCRTDILDDKVLRLLYNRSIVLRQASLMTHFA